MAIPELMRHADRRGWALAGIEAEDIVPPHLWPIPTTRCMAESLEKWPEDMVKQLLPRIYQIL